MASVINNGIPLINGMLYSWADIVATIGGVPLTGTRRAAPVGRSL